MIIEFDDTDDNEDFDFDTADFAAETAEQIAKALIRLVENFEIAGQVSWQARQGARSCRPSL